MSSTKEPQYQGMVEQERDHGLEIVRSHDKLCMERRSEAADFHIVRYKFVAKLLSGRKHVLEIGCADAFGTRIVRQEVQKLTATDFDPVFIEDVKKRMNPQWEFDAFVHDMLSGPVPGSYDGVYALDVLEHIETAKEHVFLTNMVKSLSAHGIAVLGMPSLESQTYASPNSKAGHVNCKSSPDFKATMEKYFHTVLMFCMNDEVVHTGYHKMAHYLFAVGCDQKR